MALGVSVSGDGRRFVALDDLFRMPSTSHAVVVGPNVWVGGLLGTVGAALRLPAGGVGPETAQACKNMTRVLEACGAGPEHVVQLDVLLVDTEDFLEMDRTLAGALPVRPARTTAYVRQLPIGARVELAARAYLSEVA